MARSINRLTARTVETAKKPGLKPDGGGLYLQISKTGTKSWLYRFMLGGAERWMGLGSWPDVGLAEARDLATAARRQRAAGVDPIEARKEERARARLADARSITFREAAEAYIKAHRASWRNEKHGKQWEATLETYAYPTLGTQPVQHIDTSLVQQVLTPIWSEKPETASRVRGRIEVILGREIALGHRPEPNPARWRDNLDRALPRRNKARTVRHHPALPFKDIGTFMTTLRQRDSVSAAALEIAILTAARTGEVTGARWSEIDEVDKVWTVPAERMKSDKPHRVPLSEAALAVIARMKKIRTNEFVFPGGKKDRPLSNMALLAVLRHMKRDDLTTHGFRSTFKDWSAERTAFPNEVSEAALAHAIAGATEAAYRRGELFDKRRKLMDAWAVECGTVRPPAEGQTVVAFGARSA